MQNDNHCYGVFEDMKFGKYESSYEYECSQLSSPVRAMLKSVGVDKFYTEFLRKYQTDVADIETAVKVKQHALELLWYRIQRPYFRVWPVVMACAEKVRLNIPTRELVRQGVSPPVISVEFPESHREIRSVLVFSSSSEGTSLLIIDDGQAKKLFLVFNANGSGEDDIEKQIRGKSYGSHKVDSAITAVRVALMIKMMGTNSDLVTPDLLNKHKQWLGTDKEDEYHQKAKKRGKFGWDVGKELHERTELSPHFRVPHFAIVWTGKGKTIPKFVLRTGKDGGPILVKPTKMTEVPTGYYGNEPHR